MKKGIIISIVILFLGYVTICLMKAGEPESWKFYKNTIDKFTTEDKDSILKTFDITLTSKAKISKFEKCEQNSGVWYVLTISGIKDAKEFTKINPILTELMKIGSYKLSYYLPSNQSSPLCELTSQKLIIYVGTYYEGKRLDTTEYSQDVENLFEKLWKEKQSK